MRAGPRLAARRAVRLAVPLALTALAAAGCEAPTVPPLPERVARVAVGDLHTCAITADGAAWCWGEGSAGQLGTGATASEHRPRQVAGGLVLDEITAGGAHTCGLTDDGAAYCWGNDAHGQLGDGGAATPGGASEAFAAAPVAVAGGLSFAALSAGLEHTCGVTASGAAYCWGRGADGRLGTGQAEDRGAPAPVLGGASFVAVSAGGRHSCGLTTAGVVRCWGANDQGQLGTGSAGAPVLAPTQVASGATFIDVTAGRTHSCAVRAGGAPFCWGSGAHGELGTGSWYERDQPGEVAPAPVLASGQTYVSISAGAHYTCGLRNQGETMCWGRGYEGQLGNGELLLYVVPQLVLGEPGREMILGRGPFLRVDAGGTEHACGIISGADVVCWGRSSRGQLGIEDWLTTYPQVVRIPPL